MSTLAAHAFPVFALFVTQLYQRVPVLDTGARAATVTFAQRNKEPHDGTLAAPVRRGRAGTTTAGTAPSAGGRRRTPFASPWTASGRNVTTPPRTPSPAGPGTNWRGNSCRPASPSRAGS
jgi:hypothetical protein